MAVTKEQIATATKTTKPSIQAVFLSSLSAVPTSIAMDKILETINILSIKSFNACLNSEQKELSGGVYLWLLPYFADLA